MEKSAIFGQIPDIGTSTESGYRYPLDRSKVVPVPIKVVPVPIYQKGIGTGIEQGGTGTGSSSNPIFAYFALLSPMLYTDW